jgi:K+-sensing histidine kinase KdpD
VETYRFKIILPYMLAVLGITFLMAGMFAFKTHFNPITVALIFLLFVLFLATVFGSKSALFASVLAMLCFNRSLKV